MSESSIVSRKYTISQSADYYTTEDYLVFDCKTNNNYSGIFKWGQLTLTEFEGEISFKMLTASKKDIVFVLALSSQSDEFFSAIEDKITWKSKKKSVSTNKNGFILEDGSLLGTYFYSQQYCIFIKKKLGQRNSGDLEYTYPFIRSHPPLSSLTATQIREIGEEVVDLSDFNNRFKSGQKRNKRHAYLFAALLIIIMLIIFYLTKDIIMDNGEPPVF